MHTVQSFTDLLSERDALAARVAELEAQMAAAKPAVRRRRAGVTLPCQYCGDAKTPKVTFLGLPLCAGVRDGGDGKCGSRIRNKARSGRAHEAYAYDRRYAVTTSDRCRTWTATFNGEVLGAGTDRAALRRLAAEHKATAGVAAAAA